MIIFMSPGRAKVGEFLLVDNSAMNVKMRKVVMVEVEFAAF